MGLNSTVFGTPGSTNIMQTPGQRPPGFGFAKDFFGGLGGLMNQPFPTYGGQLDPGMSPTMQDAIRRAQGYAQSGPPEILQGVQGMAGQFMSPNFMNPWNSMFGGAPDYGGVNPNQRTYGGQTAGAQTFQAPWMQGGGGGYGQSGPPQRGMQAGRVLPGGGIEGGGFVGGQWQPNQGGGQGQGFAPGGPGSMGGGRGGMMPWGGGQGQPTPYGGGMPQQPGMPGAPPSQGIGQMPGQGGGGMTLEAYQQSQQAPGGPNPFQMGSDQAAGALINQFGGRGNLTNPLQAQYGQGSQFTNGFMHSGDHQAALQQLLGREPTFDEVQKSWRSGSGNIEAARNSYMAEGVPDDRRDGWTPAMYDLSALIDQNGIVGGSRMFDEKMGSGPLVPPPAASPAPPPAPDMPGASPPPPAPPRTFQGRPVVNQGGVDGVIGNGGRFQPIGGGRGGGTRPPAAGGPTDMPTTRPIPTPRPGQPVFGDGKPGRAPRPAGPTDVGVAKPINDPTRPRVVNRQPPPAELLPGLAPRRNRGGLGGGG